MNHHSALARCALSVAALSAVAFGAWAAGPSTVSSAINAQVQTEKGARDSQRKIDNYDDQTQQIVAEYRSVLAESASLRRYLAQLSQQVKSQDDEVVSMIGQLEEIEQTNREVLPMMEKMVGTLTRFVELDVPFLPTERAKRVGDLETLMVRADVSTAEKYRRILEAYQIEMEFGRDIETYRGELGDTGREVDFLRVGRVALLYQQPDGGESGYWDNNARKYVVDNELKRPINDGLRIARKQSAPNLIIMPIQAPQEAN